jgi:adenosylcobinamide kinase / adenosylcobinamide-phosphate guanylyltransferase
MKTLVIGGARSGKSAAAEAALGDASDVTYVATGYPADHDTEWAARVARHVAHRPPSWTTVETLDVAGVLAEPGGPLLVDCLTLWLTRVLDRADAWESDASIEPDTSALLAALRASARDVVIVTNEVGQGVVPASAVGRRFRDEMGLLNAVVAAECDDVLWCVAGRVVRL